MALNQHPQAESSSFSNTKSATIECADCDQIIEAIVIIPLHSSSLKSLESLGDWGELLSTFTSLALPSNRCRGIEHEGKTNNVKAEKLNSFEVSGVNEFCDTSRKNSCPEGEENSRHKLKRSHLLLLQSHSEGVMWRALFPLLTSSKLNKCSNPNVTDLTHESKKSSYNLSSRTTSIMWNHYRRTSCHFLLCFSQRGNSPSNGDFHQLHHNLYGSWAIKSTSLQYTAAPKEKKNDAEENSSHPLLFVFVFPPNPLHQQITYSRNPQASPLSQMTKRLIHLENNLIRLTSVSAYISTLGGGFFLCRYLSTALTLAKQQCRIAYMRGDEAMAWKCRINEGYCYIYGGKLNRAKRVIRNVYLEVCEKLRQNNSGRKCFEDPIYLQGVRVELDELTIIKNMCKSAFWFANKVIDAGLRDHDDVAISVDMDAQNQSKVIVGEADTTQLLSATHDDYQRLRIVRDRKWR